MPTYELPDADAGEIAVIGMGASGVAAATLLRSRGHSVYISDGGAGEMVQERSLALASRGVSVDVGRHDLARIAAATLVVVSPGIAPSAAPVIAAVDAGVAVVSEIEIALRCAPGLRYIAVTGTNGKTTTTALVGHLLRALGLRAPDAGNIGTPLSEILLASEPPEWVALELSSFQLHDTPSVAPAVGVLTNLSPDHLDRYPDVNSYFADKALIFRNATADSVWVINADDERSMRMTDGIEGNRRTFSVRDKADAWYDRETGVLEVLGHRVASRSALSLLGDHNVANALAATLAVICASAQDVDDASRSAVAAALGSFHAMPHRLETVGEWNGVQWINDSKATNVDSTRVAVAGMTRPTILLLGGRHKGEPYSGLIAALAQHVKHVIAYGEAAGQVVNDLEGAVPLTRVDGSFEEVMARARQLAETGDSVLLSPACSSYDMFNNYVERGERFRDLAARNE